MLSSNPALIDIHLGEGCTEEYSAAVEQSQLGGGSVAFLCFVSVFEIMSAITGCHEC